MGKQSGKSVGESVGTVWGTAWGWHGEVEWEEHGGNVGTGWE